MTVHYCSNSHYTITPRHTEGPEAASQQKKMMEEDKERKKPNNKTAAEKGSFILLHFSRTRGGRGDRHSW
ncbi:hypothetical protein E2C01_075352 [Portunus trituberculatus]|uniref:Uncharacterized protein n=1 Tax=Portunus trituberculatus TaxID=210409 RepID=A0A5B7I5V9_PORTR|nr:hypothetical protein [Portunus trituberculatus]